MKAKSFMAGFFLACVFCAYIGSQTKPLNIHVTHTVEIERNTQLQLTHTLDLPLKRKVNSQTEIR